LLIVEGPDGVGKTTLCRALLKRFHENHKRYSAFPVIYHHFSRPPSCWHFPRSYLPYVTRHTVCDRFHLSEMCYALVRPGGADPFTENMVRLLEAHLMLAGSYTVLLTASEEFLRWQWSRKGDKQEMYDVEQVVQVNRLYENLQERHPEARVDFHFRLDACREDSFLSLREDVMDDILMAWSSRLAYIFTHTGDFYGTVQREVEAVRPVLR
jgi:thymidylate kinase